MVKKSVKFVQKHKKSSKKQWLLKLFKNRKDKLVKEKFKK